MRVEALEDRSLPSTTLILSASGPSRVSPGADIVYTVSLSNTGASAASSVTLSDLVPGTLTSCLSYVQTSGPAFSLSSSSSGGGGSIGSFPAGATASFSVVASVTTSTSVTEGTTLTDSANVSTMTTLDGGSVTSATVTSTFYRFGPVSVTNPGTQSSTDGGSASLSVSASDSISGSTLHYAASNLPPGLSINPGSGTITGTVALGASAASPYTTTVTASDGSASASATFTWNVSSPVTLTNPGTHSSAEGATVSVSLSATDSSGTPTYAAVGLPPGLAINTISGAITGTVAAGDAASSPYTVTVTAADGTYSASQSFTWTVTGPVTIVQPPDQSNTEGDSVSLAISGHDSGSGTLVYGATGLPPGLSISTSTGAISGTIAAGAADLGPYSVTVTAGDGTSSASQTFTWNVKSPVSIVTPADQTNSEGDTVSLSLSASDSSGTLTYGAIGLPAGLSISASTGAISGTVSAGDAANGPYTVTLLGGDGTYRNTTSFTWTINAPITLTAPADQTNNAGDTVSLAVSASGTPTFSATGLPPGLSIGSSSGVISGTITAGGSFTPTVTATASGHSTSAGFNWTVSSPITITDAGPQAFNAGDTVSVPITATDTASGTLSYSASGLPSGTSISSSTGLISGTLSSSITSGVYDTTVTVTDGTHTAVDTFAWTIYGTSVTKMTNPGAQSSAEGAAVSLTVSASYSGSGTVVYAAEGLPPGLKINAGTGAITGTVAAGDALLSPYSVIVTATDGSNTDSQTFAWTVTSLVTLTNPGDQSGTEGGSVSLSLSASYSGSGSITYAAEGLPPGLKINTSTGAITGTIAAGAGADGPYGVSVFASAGGSTAEQDLTWTVNSPVTISAISDQTSNEAASVSLSISASDSSSGTMKYAAQGLPPGLKINTGTGAITGTVAIGAAADGPYDVTIFANDGTYIGSAEFTWTVNSPVTITQPADQTSNEGASASLSISASDTVSGSTLKYAAQGLPPGLVISATTGAISGTVTAGDAAAGPYSVIVGANDGTYSASTSFTWNVNSPITIVTPADQTNDAGQSATLTIAATDAATGTLTYSASGLPTGASISSSTGAITGTLTRGGSWSPTVTVSDGTYSNSVSFAWAVSSPILITDPGDQTNATGASVSVQVSAVDNASGTLSYSATGLPSSLSISGSTGLISGTVSTLAWTPTPYTVSVTVTDGTRTAVDTFSWTITQTGTLTVGYPGAQTNVVGDMVAVQTTATDTSYLAYLFSVSGLPSGLYLNPRTGLIFGTIASGASGSSPYSVTVTATDSASNSASQTFTWTVSAAPTVTMVNPGDQTNTEGDSVSVAVSASDSSSGTLRYVAFGLPPGLSINTSTGTISGTVAIGDAANGPYTVTIVANDGTYSAAQTFNWTINSPVTITQPADQTSTEGASASLSISASDAASGTLVYAAQGLPPGLSINTSTGAISGTVAPGDAADGPYSVTVMAGDGTYSNSTTFNWTVNSPITITTPDDQTNNEGDSVSLTVSASDSSSGTLSYVAVGLPPGLSINASTGAITGTVATSDGYFSSYSPTIIASDGTYSSTTSFNWDVNGVITITDPGSQVSVVGDAVSVQVGATDTGSGTMTYAATGLPTGLSINTSSGLISGTISSAATSIGTFSVTLTVGDGTDTATDTFNWTVTAAGTITLTTPSNQSSVEGSSPSLSLSASGGGTKHYFAEGLPPGLKINPSTGAITGTVAVNDAAYGPYSVSVIASDGTNSAEETFTWTVTSPVTIAAVSDQTSSEGSTGSLSISASDSSSGTLKYAAVGLPPGLDINTTTGAISGTIAAGTSAGGPYTVTVIAGDGTYSASTTFTWNTHSPITITAIADQTNTEGDTPSLTVSASGSGTLKYSAFGLPAGLKINTSTGAITGTVAAGDAANGPYTVTVTASNGTSGASTTFTWTINSPITIADPGEQDDSTGESVSWQVQANDSGAGTLTYFAFGLPAGLIINAATGLISGVISNSSDATGFFSSLVGMTDGSHTNFQTVNWTILDVAEDWVSSALGVIPLLPRMVPDVPEHNASGKLKRNTFGLETAIRGGEGTVKVFTGGQLDVHGVPGAPFSPKNCIRIEFSSTNKRAVGKAHWLQFYSMEFTAWNGSTVKAELDNPNTLLHQIVDNGTTHYVDTVSRDEPLYDVSGGSHIVPLSLTSNSLVDRPIAIYPEYKSVRFSYDTYLEINGKVYYHIHWEWVGTFDRKTGDFSDKYENISGEPVTKKTLPDWASGDEVFLGWKTLLPEKRGLSIQDRLKDKFSLKNPIKR